MSYKVELIPIAESEGNRITVKEEETVLVGRGSSLGVRRGEKLPSFSFENLLHPSF
jgi:hypothetical protein